MRHKKVFSMTIMLIGAAVLVGCNDPKQRIAMLESENQSLGMELERLRDINDNLRQARDNCQSELMASQQTNNDLRGQLADASTQQDLPGDWQPVAGGAMVAVEGSVLFKAGQAILRPDSQNVLDRLASEINSSFSNKDIYVFGHTDTDPIRRSGWKDNRELSAQRALAVVRYLQSHGVPPNRVVACGWGEHRPVAPNTSNDGKKRNRRVEMFAADPALVASR